MKVLVDTNIWVSAFLWPDSLPNRVLQTVIRDHNVVLSSEIIDELRDVFNRKFPHRLADLEMFLSRFSYVLVPEPLILKKNLTKILRDPNDLHVLVAAVEADVDILLTGDQDFTDLPLQKPLILTPRQYAEKYPERLLPLKPDKPEIE